MFDFLKNKDIKNSIITLFIRGLGVLILFGLSIAMTQNLQAKWVGYYEFSRVVLLCISTIALVGTDQAILYFSGKFHNAESKESLLHIYKKMLILVSLFSLIFTVLFVLLPQSIFIKLGVKKELIHVLHYSVMILPFYAFSILNTETLRAFGCVFTAEIYRNILKHLPISVGVFCISFHWFAQETILSWYLYGFVFLAIASFLSVFFIKKSDPEKQEHQTKMKEVFQTSYPMAISSFYTFLLMFIDVFLIGQYYDTAHLAYYAIAMKVMSILSLVIVAVNINFAPEIARCYHKKDFKSLQYQCKKAAKFIAICNGMVGIILLLFRKEILLIFGQEYVQALNAFIVLIGIQTLISCFGLAQMYLNMTGKQHLFHRIMLASLLINLTLNLILIPKYSLCGAAIAYAVTVLFWNACVAWFAYKKDKIILPIWK